MGLKSPRSTALYQTDAFSSTVTSPISTAVGAMNAVGCTTGDFPSKLYSGMGSTLAVCSDWSSSYAEDRRRRHRGAPASIHAGSIAGHGRLHRRAAAKLLLAKRDRRSLPVDRS